jgi:monofunctional glycosyltransferase
VPTGRNRDRENTKRLAASDIVRRIANDDDVVTGEAAAGLCQRSFYGDGWKPGALLAIGAKRAELEIMIDAARLELQRGTACDVSREQRQTNAAFSLKRVQECGNAGVETGAVSRCVQLIGEATQIRAIERLESTVDRSIGQSGDSQQLASNLRIGFAVEGVRGNRAGCAVDFEQRGMKRATGGTIRAQQGSVNIEQDQAAHSSFMVKRLMVAIPLGLVGAAWFFLLSLPWPVALPFRNPRHTSFMELRLSQAKQRGDTLRIRQNWKPLGEISRNLRRAVIVAEDGNFYEHHGIDWAALREEVRYRGDDDFSWFSTSDVKALFGALNYYRSHRDRIRGRSTLTQQLAKNLYFGEDRSLVRKVGEFVVAKRLEWFLSKDRIFEVYLNVVEWGPGIFGADAAARHYFGTTASKLSADQAATLAATLPHPLTSNPKLRPGRMTWRKGLILARMGGTGPVKTVPLEPLPLVTDTVVTPPDSVKQTQPDSIKPDSVKPDTVPPDTGFTARSIARSSTN